MSSIIFPKDMSWPILVDFYYIKGISSANTFFLFVIIKKTCFCIKNYRLQSFKYIYFAKNN